jgi:hypothetical protein
MRFRLVSAALALFAVAGVAKADLAWDGVAQVPGMVAATPGQYLVCPKGTRLDFRTHEKCVDGFWSPSTVSKPKAMSLQQALDMHFNLPAGLTAVAQGPMPSFNRYGFDAEQFGIAYKLEKK